MAFDIHPGAGPPTVPAGSASGLLPFTALSVAGGGGVSPITFVRVVQLGTSGPAAPPALAVTAGGGPLVTLPDAPGAVDVFDDDETLQANADVKHESNDVHVMRIRILGGESSWKLQISNNDSHPHQYLFVVADNDAEASQPWIDVSAVPEFNLVVHDTVSHDVRIANRGTGKLALKDQGISDLGAGFRLTSAPATVAPNSVATCQATFTASGAPGRSAVVVDYDSDDPRAGLVAGHNRRLRLTATVQAPLWRSGDVLVVDSAATDGRGQAQKGALVRIDRSTGVQTVIACGRPMNNPTGVVAEASGDALVSDSGGFGGGGGVIRVDRLTGGQSVVAQGGNFTDPAGLVITADGAVVVVDSTALGGTGALIKVDPATGQQSVLASGDLFGRPVAVALEANGSLVVIDPRAAGGQPAAIRVSPAGQQALVAGGTLAGVPVAVAIAPDGGILVLTDGPAPATGRLVRIDPGGGPQQRLTDVAAPNRLTVLGNGQVLCTVRPSPSHPDCEVITIDTGGSQHLLSVGAQLRSPLGIAVVDGDLIPVDEPPTGGE